jgi:hypothetical protein
LRRVASWPRVFWDFWWDFLVGDTPELFVAAMVIMVVALLLRPHSSVAVIVLPCLAVVSLVVSVYRGARSSSAPNVVAAAASEPTGEPPDVELGSSGT